MKLSKEQLNGTIEVMIDPNTPASPFIDSNVLAYSNDIIDIILSSILDYEEVLTEEDFDIIIEDYAINQSNSRQHLIERDFQTGDIILQVYYSDAYINTKLNEIIDYFIDIQYYEGCSNLQTIITLLNTISKPKQ